MIASRNPDLKAFCQAMKNQLNAVDYAKFINEKEPATWEMIDTLDYLNGDELLIFVQSINIQNQELFKRSDKACLQNNECSRHEFR